MPDDRRRFSAMTRFSFLAADHVAFFSESARRDALADGVLDPLRTSVVPLGTDHLEEAAQASPAAERPPRRLDARTRFLLVLGNAYLHKNRLYAIRLAMTKEGDHLTLDFSGTDKQARGTINCAPGGLEGGVYSAVLPMLCFDLPWCPAALQQSISIVSDPGTLNNARFPAAIGTVRRKSFTVPIGR